jgi:hypothetical protein
MSHILEEYAKNLGVLISKPVVSKHFFPIFEEKYITIYSEKNIQSKNYLYYNLVLDLIRPILLEKNIKIIQIDCDNNYIQGINKALGSLSFRQNAYIISKAIMHIGIDNVYSQYASSIGVPVITLFGNIYPSVTNPYWSSEKIKKDIAAPWSVKPCLGIQDLKSEINSIKPEQIAQAIIDLLKLNKKINFKTIKIGSIFLNSIYEIIPTSFYQLPISENDVVYLRADYGLDENSFFQYCAAYKVGVVTNQPIQLKALEKVRNNIKNISIFINKNDELINERYFEILKIWGIEVNLLVKEEKDLGYLKNKYFDQNVNLYISNKEKPQNISEKTFFFSNKKIFKDGKEYASKAHLTNQKNIVDSQMNVIDTPEYWEEQEHHYYYEQN